MALLTRRSCLAAMAVGGIYATSRYVAAEESAVVASQPIDDRSLGELAQKAGITFGAAIGDAIFSDVPFRQLYLDHARIVTSDTALKFLLLRPTPAAPQYGAADDLVNFALSNNMQFRGHCLIWNENNPQWVNSLSKSEMGVLLDKHVTETVGRYAGRMHSWDVVNEPFWPDHGAPGGFRKGPWYNALGPAYIGRALRRAAIADPKAKLVINEAFTERGDALGLTVRAGLLRLIDDLQHSGAPLHAIGLEAHLQPQYPSDDDGFMKFLDGISARGLEIYLTELDIDDSSLPRDIPTRDREIGKRVETFLSRALTNPAVKIVECWELSDRYSWYADPALLAHRPKGDFPRPLPFDRDCQPKLMKQAIANAFQGRTRR